MLVNCCYYVYTRVFSSSYVVKIDINGHYYVVYVDFKEKEERGLNAIPLFLSLKHYVSCVIKSIDIDYPYVNRRVTGTYLRIYY